MLPCSIKAFLPINKKFADAHPDFIDQIQKEWVKYAFLVAKSNAGVALYSKQIDKYWHTFMMYPMSNYREFCQALSKLTATPTSFIHRDSRGIATRCENDCRKQIFIDNYQHHFGQNPNPLIWDTLYTNS